jgi:hypothetical protein
LLRVTDRLFNDALLRNDWNVGCGVDEHRNRHGENTGARQANRTLKCAQQAMAVHWESPFVSFMPLRASLASVQSDQANRFLFPEKYPPRTKIPLEHLLAAREIYFHAGCLRCDLAHTPLAASVKS